MCYGKGILTLLGVTNIDTLVVKPYTSRTIDKLMITDISNDINATKNSNVSSDISIINMSPYCIWY